MAHGITINEITTGARPMAPIATAVIGLVATAADADAEVFPLDKPVLITDVRAAIGEAGTAGTLAKVLTTIAQQCSPILVVVRVAPGVASEGVTVEEATAINVIGGTAGGNFTGLQALLAAEAQLGVRPRIIGAPGLDTQEVAEALATVARQLRGMAYASCIAGGADSVAEAVLYRAEFSARELMLIDNDFTGFAGEQIATALGTRARIDQETGFHKTLSNVAVAGATGLLFDRHFDLQSADNDAGVLNAANVTTIVRKSGYRFWGNRTCSDEPKFEFESAVRTGQVLQDTIAAGLMWAVDKPVTPGLIRDILESINANFRLLASTGRLVGASAWFDGSQNDAASLAAGRVTIDYDYTPCAPAENIILNQRITDRFYAGISPSR